ncbi:MAG: NifB/NifX family molybdenum-iron cluster-binding protein [Spirochaetaceae bacterium]|nr:NifB/NifX family molybdenum-iron cluster-binding protein [Spirochaetaceae bacterium]
MKYAIPTDDGKTVGKVFGRAKSFALYDHGDGSYTILPNEGADSEHGAGTGAAAFLAEKGGRTVIAPEVGPKAASALASAGIAVAAAPAGIEIGEAMARIVAPSA